MFSMARHAFIASYVRSPLTFARKAAHSSWSPEEKLNIDGGLGSAMVLEAA
ncbi:MAG: hypothetical protein KIS86_15435 [Devosia sp.]|nr:hypothetical protein [Devosia sp.]